MLEVKTKIAPSGISGIVLFAAEFIPKGTVVWKFAREFDILMSKEEAANLSKAAQEQFYNYAYLDKTHGKYLLCADDARFFNHAEDPNCDEREGNITTALRDIKIGEELTVNYKDFYGDIKDHPEVL